MAKQDVLGCVKIDLAFGRTHVARQRLRTLLTIDPDDLEVRDMLADVYRQTGNLAEAGRWAYLSPELPEEEATAFEHAHPSPWLRLRLVRFGGDLEELAPAGHERLGALTAEAERVGPPPDWTDDDAVSGAPRSMRLPCLFVVVTMLVIGSLVAIGCYRLLLWLIAL